MFGYRVTKVFIKMISKGLIELFKFILVLFLFVSGLLNAISGFTIPIISIFMWDERPYQFLFWVTMPTWIILFLVLCAELTCYFKKELKKEIET